MLKFSGDFRLWFGPTFPFVQVCNPDSVSKLLLSTEPKSTLFSCLRVVDFTRFDFSFVKVLCIRLCVRGWERVCFSGNICSVVVVVSIAFCLPNDLSHFSLLIEAYALRSYYFSVVRVYE